MPIFLAVLLGIVQGITEFLPVSSSGHLVVFQHFLEPLFGAQKTTLAFDVLVHVATLFVTLAFLKRDLASILRYLFQSGPEGAVVRGLALRTIIGTLPAVVVVLFFKDQIETAFSSVRAAAGGFVVTALLLELAHRKQLRFQPTTSNNDYGISWPLPTPLQALLIGTAQAVAILPGVSRSGSTIAAALLLGLPAESALRFSFFLFIPAVLGAAVLQLKDLAELSASHGPAYAAGFVSTILVGWFAVQLLATLLRSAKLRYFAIYVACLGLVLLIFGA